MGLRFVLRASRTPGGSHGGDEPGLEGAGGTPKPRSPDLREPGPLAPCSLPREADALALGAAGPTHPGETLRGRVSPGKGGVPAPSKPSQQGSFVWQLQDPSTPPSPLVPCDQIPAGGKTALIALGMGMGRWKRPSHGLGEVLWKGIAHLQNSLSLPLRLWKEQVCEGSSGHSA